MSKQLLYLFGEPGTGKITVARVLQKRLGWRLFWLHDLDSVCNIVGRYPLPRLMDRISLVVLEELMRSGENVVYVRPSRDRITIVRVLNLAELMGYCCCLIRLRAERSTMVERVCSRATSPFRISSEAELDRYLTSRPPTSWGLGEQTIHTDGKTPEQVFDEVQQIIFEEKTYGNSDGRTGYDRTEVYRKRSR